MKLPRDVSGDDLAKALIALGYEITRQSGSHMRLTTTEDGEHHISIPRHSPLKIGTLAAILNDVAAQFQISRVELLAKIKF
ncbi:MAG: type II toxin-antitoxin system HicA family toxin [Pyrinomonadaceae bacterium]|jgi:predicted RNA binding protein YcfA (HicA-like mRNA interferase family)|nr:type II toxin-antitoxin system HicA family toxin [Pyrinomonadaceae bacterium]MDQ3584483.1 type II toxin-antitoxin system HicA family toxin [Acidobacteriota bacterium]